MKYKSGFLSALLLLFFPVSLLAQIIPDNTLGGESSRITSPSELRSLIEGGAVRGENLFHSFEQFNVGEGLEAYFANPENISNIFSRVTGNSGSEIFGTLGVEGFANLFFINSNGILFGENSAIDVGGSFIASTAESIGFENGEEFSSDLPNLPSLSINIPVSLNIETASEIVAEGLEHGVTIEIPNFNSTDSRSPQGLVGSSGQTVSLVGGGVTFRGGGITNESGRIELGSVGDNQQVSLTQTDQGWVTGFEGVTDFRDINLLEATKIDSSGEEAGGISIFGRNITLDDASVILANTFTNSEESLKSISINATESLLLQGNQDINTNAISFISADLLESGTGQGLNIDINAAILQLFDGAQIRAINFSDDISFTGLITIDAQQIDIAGIKFGEVPSTFDIGETIGGLASRIINSTGFETTGAKSNNIIINTDTLNVSNGGRINADSFGEGSAGNLEIFAQTIELFGLNELAPNRTTTFATNNEGNIRINTNQLRVADGAEIRAEGSGGLGGSSRSGNIEINAQNIEVVGYGREEAPAVVSGIFSGLNTSGSGNSGNITIETDTIQVLDGARVQADNGNGGDGGNIVINARKIDLKGTRSRIGFFRAGITSSSNRTGSAGNIILSSNSITITDGSQINLLSRGTGDGGNIDLTADEIFIEGNDRFSLGNNSGIFTNSNGGNGGNINVNVSTVFLRNMGVLRALSSQGDGGQVVVSSDRFELQDAEISASTGELGNGGNVEIFTGTLLGLNSDIVATSEQGLGGNIVINADGVLGFENIFALEDDGVSSVDASSEFGIDGQVIINSPDIFNRDPSLDVAVLKFAETDPQLISSCQANLRSGNKPLLSDRRSAEWRETPDDYLDVPTKDIDQTLDEIAWKPGEPLEKGEVLVKTENGKVFYISRSQLKNLEQQHCSTINE